MDKGIEINGRTWYPFHYPENTVEDLRKNLNKFLDINNLNMSKESILIRINKLGSSNAKFMLSLIIYSREHKYERYTDDSGEMEHIRFDDGIAFAMTPEFADLFDNIINLINK